MGAIASEQGRAKALERIRQAEEKHNIRFVWAGIRLVLNEAHTPRLDTFGVFRREPSAYVGLQRPDRSVAGSVSGYSSARMQLNTIDLREIMKDIRANEMGALLTLYPDEVLVDDGTFPRLLEKVREWGPFMARQKGRYSPSSLIGDARATSRGEAEALPAMFGRELLTQRLLTRQHPLAEDLVKHNSWTAFQEAVQVVRQSHPDGAAARVPASWATQEMLRRVAADTATLLTIGRDHQVPDFAQWQALRHAPIDIPFQKVTAAVEPLFAFARSRFDMTVDHWALLGRTLALVYQPNGRHDERKADGKRWEAPHRYPESDNWETRAVPRHINALTLELLGKPLADVPPLPKITTAWAPPVAREEEEEAQAFLL